MHFPYSKGVMSTTIEEIRAEYMARNNLSTLSADDERFIKAKFNLRKNYAAELEKRKTSILIDLHSINHAPVVKEPQKNTTQKKEVKKTAEVQICQATKMDGNPCTAKAKPGCVFCGRHLPKEK